MCDLCGATPCKPNRGKLTDDHELNADDWHKVWWFMQYVYLPFMHNILIEARKREGLSVRTGRMIRGRLTLANERGVVE